MFALADILWSMALLLGFAVVSLLLALRWKQRRSRRH